MVKNDFFLTSSSKLKLKLPSKLVDRNLLNLETNEEYNLTTRMEYFCTFQNNIAWHIEQYKYGGVF